jgi:hypothetical protein
MGLIWDHSGICLDELKKIMTHLKSFGGILLTFIYVSALIYYVLQLHVHGSFSSHSSYYLPSKRPNRFGILDLNCLVQNQQ